MTFNPGDKIRRLIDSWGSVKVGDIVTVRDANEHTVHLEGRINGFMASRFELVEAAPIAAHVPESLEPDPIQLIVEKLRHQARIYEATEAGGVIGLTSQFVAEAFRGLADDLEPHERQFRNEEATR